MTTMPLPSPRATQTRTMVGTVRSTLRWVREAPAPYWEGDARDKTAFVAYIGASMIVWTLLGLLVTAGFGRLLDLVP